MADTIFIQGLEISCIIGTLSRERVTKQKVVIDLEFPASVRKAARRDDLKDAINYKKIADRVTGFVSTSRFHLIETLAERVATLLFEEFPILAISLRISKPKAVRNAQNVMVQIKRKRKGLSE